jgi:two-component system sensor histidine kinase KdpD
MGRVRVLPSGRRDAGPEITRVGLFQSFRRFGVRAMTQAEVDGCRRLPRRLSALPVIRQAAGWAFGVVVPLVAIGPATLNHELIGLPTEVVLLFLATVVVALVGGLGPGLLVAVGGGLLDFFGPPIYTLAISEREKGLSILAMTLAAVFVSMAVERGARSAQQANLLASSSRPFLSGADPLTSLLAGIREAFALTSVAIVQRREGSWTTTEYDGLTDRSDIDDADVDIAVDPDTHLVGCGRALSVAERRVLAAVVDRAWLTLRNQQLVADAADARRRAEASPMTTALLRALGHDLRNPLASIKAIAGVLRDMQLRLSDADRAELFTAIEESVDHLTGLVNNLLDSSRITAGVVAPIRQPLAYDEVVAQALVRLEGGHRVTTDIDERLPEVLADPGLLERVIANLVDNALRHGAGAPVTLRARTCADRIELRVVDRGPGVPPGQADRLFAPFRRLGNPAHSGLGLGLSIARGFTEAMGGTLTAEDTPGGGLTVVIGLPIAFDASVSEANAS